MTELEKNFIALHITEECLKRLQLRKQRPDIQRLLEELIKILDKEEVNNESVQ